MRVFVTGAGGFVGGHLVPRLRRDGHDVAATDIELDVSDADAVADAVAGFRPDAIVHLAAVSSVAQSHRQPTLTYRVNFLGTCSVLGAAARHAPDARVLLVGSADEYGSAEPGAPPFTEASPLRPGSPYSRTKAAAGLLGTDFAARGLDVVRTRAFNHTGPGQSDVFVVSSFARQLAEIECGKREPRLRVGNLDSVRDFLDVRDVVEAYVRLLAPGVPAGVYNVASGRGLRVGEILDRLCGMATRRPAIETDPERVRPTDHSVGDASRLRAATGWEPRVSFDDTLAELLAEWRRRVNGGA